MDTDSPPPPPPPPLLPSHGKWACTTHPTPCPQHAALPFNINPPIQETNPSHTAPHHAQDTEAPPMQHLPPFPPSNIQEVSPSNEAEKDHPVQETDPAPQALHAPQIPAQGDEQTTQTDLSGQDHLV